MAILFGKESENYFRVTKKIGGRLVPPRGWFTAEQLQSVYANDGNGHEQDVERSIAIHLPMAAKRAELLIDALKRKFNIEVPESYLRVRADAAFQVLLLVKGADYVSPKIAAARLLAEEYAQTETYDLCFTFSVLSESVDYMVLPNDYKLKHLQEKRA